MSATAVSQNPPRHSQAQQGERKSWEVCKTFEEGSLKVVIKKLDLFRPRYSFNVGAALSGAENSGTGFSPHISPKLQVVNAKVVLEGGVDVLALNRLVTAAQIWILEKTQEREDEILRHQIAKAEKERRGPGQDKKVRAPGKTEREQAKNARHAQNVEARRQADQERTQACKSGRKIG